MVKAVACGVEALTGAFSGGLLGKLARDAGGAIIKVAIAEATKMLFERIDAKKREGMPPAFIAAGRSDYTN